MTTEFGDAFSLEPAELRQLINALESYVASASFGAHNVEFSEIHFYDDEDGTRWAFTRASSTGVDTVAVVMTSTGGAPWSPVALGTDLSDLSLPPYIARSLWSAPSAGEAL